MIENRMNKNMEHETESIDLGSRFLALGIRLWTLESTSFHNRGKHNLCS